MTDTLKQPAPTSAPLPYEPIPVGSGPAAILDIPRSGSVPAAPPAPRPAPPRQTQPIPPTPAPAPQPPVALTPSLPAPLPPGIAPEAPPTEPAAPAGTPAPKPGMFRGIVWDLLRPNRTKVAVLAGVASLAVGAFAMPLLFPSLSGGGGQQPKAKVTVKVPPEEPAKEAEKTPAAPAPVAAAPVAPVKKADAGGWNPLEPDLPPLPVVGAGGRTDLPPPVDTRQPGAGAGTLVAPRMPADGLPPLPELLPSQPTQPAIVDPHLRLAAGQGAAPAPVVPSTPTVGGPLPAAPSGPAQPDPLPALPSVGGAGPVQPVLPQPTTPGQPALPTNPFDDKKPLPVPTAPGVDSLPTTPGTLPIPGVGGGGGTPLPAPPPALPGVGSTGTLPLPTPQPEVKPQPLPLPTPQLQPEIKPQPLPGFPGEVKPLDTKPTQPDQPLPGAGAPPPAPRIEPRVEPLERVGGTNTGFPTGGGTGPGATLQPPVSESKSDYDLDLYRPRAGDTYAAVSKSFYGSPQYADALRTFNRDQPIERVAEVQVPPVHVIRKYAPARAADPLPNRGDRFPPARANPDEDPVWGPPGTAQGGQVVYTLFTVPRKGLTLKDVAKTYYGSERSWTKLDNSRNRKFDPDEELPVGTQLHVPTETVPFR